jgi:hypothetical protein
MRLVSGDSAAIGNVSFQVEMLRVRAWQEAFSRAFQLTYIFTPSPPWSQIVAGPRNAVG